MLTKKAASMALALVGALILAGPAFGESYTKKTYRTVVFQKTLIGENGQVGVAHRGLIPENDRGQAEVLPVPLPEPRLGPARGSVEATPIEIPRSPKVN